MNIPKKKEKKKNYIDKHEMLEEILKSKKRGRLTERAGSMMLLLVENLQRKYFYKSTEFKEDIAYRALITILEKWQRFDENNPRSNCFSWFTTVAHNALKAAVNEHNRGIKIDYSYDELFDEAV